MARQQSHLQRHLSELIEKHMKGGTMETLDSEEFLSRMIGFAKEGFARQPSPFDKVMAEVQAKYPKGTWSYEDIVSDATLPIGHRRMVAVYFSAADIDNGGFVQYFGNGFGCLSVPAIEAFEQSGQIEIARVMKIAMQHCITQRPAPNKKGRIKVPGWFWEAVDESKFRLPPGFLDGVEAKGWSFDKLNRHYYRLQENLPGAETMPTGYPDGFIGWYMEKFPLEFVSVQT